MKKLYQIYNEIVKKNSSNELEMIENIELIKETNNYFIFEDKISSSKYKIYAPNMITAIKKLKKELEQK